MKKKKDKPQNQNLFPKYRSNKRYVSNIDRELLKLSHKKANNQYIKNERAEQITH